MLIKLYVDRNRGHGPKISSGVKKFIPLEGFFFLFRTFYEANISRCTDLKLSYVIRTLKVGKVPFSENFLVKFAFLSCGEIDGSLTGLEMCDKTPTARRSGYTDFLSDAYLARASNSTSSKERISEDFFD